MNTILSRTPMRLGSQVDHPFPRVLHVITGMERGGAEKIAVQLAAAAPSDSAISWLSGESAWVAETMQIREKAPLRMNGLLGFPGAISRLAALIRRNRPDVLHSHLSHANVAARWAARISRYAGPVVSTEHNLGFYRDASGWLLRLDARTSRRCAAVAAISGAVKRHRQSAGWQADRIRVIYNGVSLPAAPTAPELKNPVMLGMVGRLHPEKGPDLFLDVLERLDSVGGILLTHGPDKMAVEARIQQSTARARIQIDRTLTANELFRSVDIALVPSRLEGLGLAALEAMSWRRPVVAANTGGLPEVVLADQTGLLAEPGNPDDFADAVRRLADEPNWARSLGDAGRKRVEERFTIERMLAEYEALYREVAA